MRPDTFRLLAIIAILLFLCFSVNAQDEPPVCPQGFTCLTQTEANAARDAVKERDALRDAVKVRDESLAMKDASIRDLEVALRNNTAELKDRLQKTEIELARVSGQLTECRDDRNYLRAFAEVLVKSTRKKSVGIIAF